MVASPAAVSVVVPCFNAERFIGEALESALSQTLPPAEVIVVDDASTDNSVAIARKFAPRVRTIECRTNSGYCAMPKDIGLDEARQPFVAFLDADDIWIDRKLELQMPKFADPKVGLVYACAQTFVTGQPPHGEPWPDTLPVGAVCRDFYFRCYAPNSTVVARRAALLQAEGFDRKAIFCEDYDLWLRVAFDWKVDAVPDVLMRYRSHSNQLIHRRLDQARAHLAVESRHAARFRAATGMDERERSQRAAQRLMSQLNVTFYCERNLQVARQLANLLQDAFPDLDEAPRRAVRRLHRRTYWPEFLFRLRDSLA